MDRFGKLQRWKKIITFIDENYNGIFPENDWIYGGKKHGWDLRFKKSKAFCPQPRIYPPFVGGQQCRIVATTFI
ncbi:MAG: DUF3788 family protein [Ignavibacteriales bacterium]|nr:DUF3788 family protein [Ignavibacteriales bacterium]